MFLKAILKKQFLRIVLKNSVLEQFLKIVLNCFEEQNFVWEFKYKKQFHWLILRESTIRLCLMQNFSKYLSYFQLLLKIPYKNHLNIP